MGSSMAAGKHSGLGNMCPRVDEVQKDNPCLPAVRSHLQIPIVLAGFQRDFLALTKRASDAESGILAERLLRIQS